MNKKIISTVLFLSLATVTYTPVAKCANNEHELVTASKILVSAVTGCALATIATHGLKSYVSEPWDYFSDLLPPLILIHACCSLCSFYTAYHMLKREITA